MYESNITDYLNLEEQIDEIINTSRHKYKFCDCETDCVQTLTLDRDFVNKKLYDYLKVKLNHYSTTLRLGCDVERQDVIGDMICDIDNIIIENSTVDDDFLLCPQEDYLDSNENTISYKTHPDEFRKPFPNESEMN